MSNDRNATSSETDLDRARAAARRLSTPSSAPAEESAPSGFVPFSADRFRYRRPPTPEPVPPVQTVVPPPARTGASSDWPRFLHWCRNSTGARYAFLINGQGLLVGTEGALDPQRAEVMGSRLVLALEQADQINESGAAARAVAIDLGDGWLWGARVAKEGGEWVALGAFVAALPAEAIQRLVQSALQTAPG